MKVAFISFWGLVFAFSFSVHAQHTFNPYYVVAGGFASEQNAVRFADYVMEQNYPATYAFNPSQKLFYVYVVKTEDKQFALQLAYRLRTEGVIKDAWIYNGAFGEVAGKESMVRNGAVKGEGVKQKAEGITQKGEGIKQKAEGITQEAGGVKQEAGGVKQEAGGIKQEAEGVKQKAGGVKQKAEGITQKAEGIKQEAGGIKQEAGGVKQKVGGEETEGARQRGEVAERLSQAEEDSSVVVTATRDTTNGATASVKPVVKPFHFKLIDATTGKPIKGHVKILKTEMDTVYQTFPANEITYVPQPESGKLVVVCNLVGYKFTKRVMSYAGAKTSKSVDLKQETTLTLRLTPVKRWDFIELERVKFFRNSVVMMPKSEEELQELVNMMQNPKYKIRITGHTHRDGPVEYLSLGTSDAFFREDSANEKKQSSYKELSEERAEAVKRYLVSKGVNENRISTKGMGNSLAVYGHSEADNRIEVEVLKD